MKSESQTISKDLVNQHNLPVSPQNFDPSYPDKSNQDRNSTHSHQKKLIFSPTTQRRVVMESLTDYPESFVRYEKPESNEDLRAKMSAELENNLKILKSEVLQEFATMIKDLKNVGKINHDEIQDIKTQIATNKSQFEDIQLHLAEVNEKFTEINSLCVRELEGIRATIGSNMDPSNKNYNLTVTNELSQKQLELQFKTLKQNLVNDINSLIKTKSKVRLNENVLSQLKEVKKSFEEDLRENFDQLNGRIKLIEEALNKILREKREFMEDSKNELFGALEMQEKALIQELQQLKLLADSKYNEEQAKNLVRNEISDKINSLLQEHRKLKDNINETKEEMTKTSSKLSQRIEKLDQETKLQFNQFYDILQQKKSASSQATEILGNRISRINSNLEFYQNSLNQLRNQLSQVQSISESLKNRNANSDLINRIEGKINALKTQIQQIENQIKLKTPSQQSEVKLTPDYLAPSYVTRFAKELEANNELVVSNERVTMSSYHPKNVSGSNLLFPNPIVYSEERESIKSPGLQLSHRSGVFSPYDQNQPERVSMSGTKYYGDPKVKSIIDEFYQKRREIEQKTHERMYSYPTPLLSTENQLRKSGNFDDNFGRSPYQGLSTPSTIGQQTSNIYADNILNRLRGNYSSPTPIKFELPLQKAEPQQNPIFEPGPSFTNEKTDKEETKEVIIEQKETQDQETVKSSQPDNETADRIPEIANENKLIAEIISKQSSQGASFASANDADQFQDCKENVSGVDMQEFLGSEQASPSKPKNTENMETKPNTTNTEKDEKFKEQKRIKHEKIIAQINYFIYGTLSHLLDDETDSDELNCNIDENGFIYDNEGDFVLDEKGNKVQLTPEQIDKLNKNNILE